MLHLLYSLPSFEDSAQNRNRTSDTRIFSPLLYQLSYLGIWISVNNYRVAGVGFEPTTFGLWARRASRLLHPAILCCIWYVFLFKNIPEKENGWRWIRTTEANCSRFTVCPLWPLGNPPIWSFTVFQQTSFRLTVWCKPMIGLEPITCWLQISCSANWATSAYIIRNGTYRARTYDPLLVRQMLSQLSYDPENWIIS